MNSEKQPNGWAELRAGVQNYWKISNCLAPSKLLALGSSAVADVLFECVWPYFGCAYQEVSNVSFLENFAYVPKCTRNTGLFLAEECKKCGGRWK